MTAHLCHSSATITHRLLRRSRCPQNGGYIRGFSQRERGFAVFVLRVHIRSGGKEGLDAVGVGIQDGIDEWGVSITKCRFNVHAGGDQCLETISVAPVGDGGNCGELNEGTGWWVPL